jgi:hypothetical protein
MLNSSVSTFYNASSLLEAIADVDILIDETYIGSNLTDFMTNYQITDSSKFKFLTNKKVYREDGVLSTAGGYDWFEAPVAMADALLEDMINAVNPSAPTGDYSRTWLRNIALDESIKYASAANCSWDENAPRPDLASQFDGGSFTLSSGAVNISPKQFGAALVSIATLAYLL